VCVGSVEIGGGDEQGRARACVRVCVQKGGGEGGVVVKDGVTNLHVRLEDAPLRLEASAVAHGRVPRPHLGGLLGRRADGHQPANDHEEEEHVQDSDGSVGHGGGDGLDECVCRTPSNRADHSRKKRAHADGVPLPLWTCGRGPEGGGERRGGGGGERRKG
jgi:hypothetical protein